MELSKTSFKNKCYLKRVLSNLRDVDKMIFSDKTVVGRKSNGTTTIEFKNKDGEAITPIMKEAGSPLVQLKTAIEDLEFYLTKS